MVPEQQHLSPVAENLARDEDEIAWMPCLYEVVPAPAGRQDLAHLLALDLIWLEPNGHFEGSQVGALGTVVVRNLLIVVDVSAEPFVRGFTGYRWWLSLIPATDNLDAPAVKPTEKGLEYWLGYCADFIPDDDAGNVIMSHSVGRPLGLTMPTKEAVVGLGLDPSETHLLGQTVDRGEDQGLPCSKQLDGTRGLA